MDADRSRRVETLYAAAQALSAEERPAFLADACAGDDSLRGEVEWLLDAASSVRVGSAAATAGVSSDASTHTHLIAGTVVPFGLPGSMVGRFIIRERLGSGGMGEVYRAEDTQLKRTVAIKRLVQDVSGHSGSHRLLKEAQRASALNHPHIADVYDVFAVGNELLLVMEYVDGVTLRERMKQPFSVIEFCDIALQCTAALSAAHAKKILHGDLKPANILLTRGGEVKVCDFGLARRLRAGDPAVETTTTAHHGIAGTPAYLAPEAILEEPLDERADIFSLGVVFYQMLAARHPFVADSLMATLDRVLHFSPEPIDRVNPNVPGRLARTIHRMLEKKPDDRHASAASVGETLSSIKAQRADAEQRRRRARRTLTRAVLAAAVLLAVVTGPRVADRVAQLSTVPLPQEISLAVLPFTVAGADADRQLFAEGLADSLVAQLSRLTVRRKFQVLAESDRRFPRVTNVAAARQQLGANLALSGSLRYSGAIVQVSTALVDTRSGQPLRSEAFGVAGAEAGALQTRIAQAALRMMGMVLSEDERRLLEVRMVEPGADGFYHQALAYLSDYDRIERVDNAIDLFQKALRIDPQHALAYAGLGEAYWRKHELTGSAEWVKQARVNCLAARGSSDTLAEAHVCLAMVLNGTGEYERAAEQYRIALERVPTNDLAYVGLANAYERMGELEKAEQTYLHAIDLRRHYWSGYNNLGGYYYRAGKFEQALAMFNHVVELASDSFRGYSSVGALQFKLGRIEDAKASLKQSLSIRPNFAAASNLGTLYYFEGEFRHAADLYRRAISIDASSHLVWGNLATTLEFLGRKAEAADAYTEARRLAREQLDVNPRDPALQLEVAMYSAALGDTLEFANAVKLAPEDAGTLFRIAVFYEQRLQRRDEALTWLKRAVERGQTWREIDRAPELQTLRKDPRFVELRQKLQGPG